MQTHKMLEIKYCMYSHPHLYLTWEIKGENTKKLVLGSISELQSEQTTPPHSLKNKNNSKAWWSIPLIPILGTGRGIFLSLRISWSTQYVVTKVHSEALSRKDY